ncbi:MBL fold metallo-hydrolase [Streptomyces lushanensis]|uniref:MBL fold metallo-hydrolase n=1 Tax=Streptomyces lushanensis TaxID=1434255 RepID=UPI00082A2F46|nr:MBL fold metallo-hydrolase [Streptomyces lushanensis]
MTGAVAPPGRLTRVAEGVYAYVQAPGGWCLNNAGLVVGADTSVLVDTAATESRARHLARQVGAVVGSGPDIVVNTHFHGDHVFGNGLFAPRATVVAHEGTRADMEEAGLGLRGLWPRVAWGDTRLVLPTLTFRTELTLRLGTTGPRAELLHLGPAHTATDVAVWVPGPDVLFAGDLLWSGVTPYVLMGSVEGSLRAVARMRALRPRVVVPGHGAVGGPELLDLTEEYLRWCRRIAEEGLSAGLSPLEAARRARPGPYADLVDPERLVGNLHRAYAELEGLPPGARIDVAGSFKEMCEFHGGLPECRA